MAFLRCESFCEFEALSAVVKSLATIFRFEWFFPGVNPFVSLEVSTHPEGLITIVTFEWLFSCVNPFVSLEGSTSVKGLSTIPSPFEWTFLQCEF